MTLIKDEDLLSYNLQGIIPGPQETEEAFLERAAYCKGLQNQPVEESLGPLPCTDSESAKELLLEAFKITDPVYCIQPLWMPMAFSNYKLAPWHGGCAWIFQAHEDSPTGAFMQLRKQFRHRKKYLGIYRRDELIAHELSHVGRMMYAEPQFEELLAYRSSFSSWRRWFGPIVQAPWESLLFMLSLLLLLVLDLYLQAMGEIGTYRLLLWAKLFPITLLFLGLFRVWRRHQVFNRCLGNLNKCCPDAKAANAVAYRLTDAEIYKFAGSTSDFIVEYAKTESSTSLRWRLIKAAYFGARSIRQRS